MARADWPDKSCGDISMEWRGGPVWDQKDRRTAAQTTTDKAQSGSVDAAAEELDDVTLRESAQRRIVRSPQCLPHVHEPYLLADLPRIES